MTAVTKAACPISIAVVGVGGIGSAFAFSLARAGHDVTLVARPGSPRLEQLVRDGGIVRTSGERVAARVVDGLDEHSAYDLVLVTLLAHQIDAVLPALKRSSARSIHFMFNNFRPERLRDEVGAARCSFGMPFVMASLKHDGKSDGALDLKLNPGQKTLHSDPRWVDLFEEAGLPSALEPNMLLWLRCHVPVGSSMESICVAGQRRGGGASWSEAMVAARGMKEGFALVEALGHKLYPTAKAMLGRSPTFLVATMLWVISRIKSFRELLATAAAECRALVDFMVNAAAEAEPPLPSSSLRAMRPSD